MHLLRLFVGLYGNLGLQLYPINDSCRSLLNVSLNVVIVCSVLYGLCAMDPYNVKVGKQWLETNLKPLVGVLIESDAMLVQPLAYACIVAHFGLHGRRLVRLADDELLRAAYVSLRWPLLIFVGVIGGFTGVFAVIHYSHLMMWEDQRANPWLWKLSNVLCLFMLHHCQCLILGTVHYVKYGTLHRLKSLLGRLNDEDVDYELILEQIRALARLNRKLHHLLSFPLIIFWFKTIIDSVAFICLLQTLIKDFGIFALVSITGYNVYLVRLDRQIQTTLGRIVARLKLPRNTTKLFQIRFNQQLSRMLLADDDDRTGGKGHIESPQSIQIRLQQAEMYGEQFRARLYRLCYLDNVFILNVALFVFNYSVLVIQTSSR